MIRSHKSCAATTDVPVFVVVTHEVPQARVKELVESRGAPFAFVSEGVERPIKLTKETAGDKNVGVSTASLVRQRLRLRLLDEDRSPGARAARRRCAPVR